MDLFASVPLGMKIDTRFDPPAGNWRKKKSGGRIIEYPDQWHFSAAPEAPQERMRILAVIQVQAKEGAGVLAAPRLEDGTLRVGDWRIRAELNPDRPAQIEPRAR